MPGTHILSKLFLSILCIILLTTACKKDQLQFDRVEKLEGYTTDRLNKILFISDKIGFIVGGQRFLSTTILRTRDGGHTWQYQSYPEAGKGIYGITQSPSGRIYAIGYDGKMLINPNGADAWEFRQFGLWLAYKDLAFFTNDKCVLIGGTSFNSGYRVTTYNEGATYTWDSLDYELNDIEPVNETTGYLSAYGAVLKTTDAGDHWRFLPVQNDNFEALHIVSENEVWTCGYNGSIYHTTNGGESWERMRNGNDITIPRYRLLDILFTDKDHGWAVGESGLVIYTDDGGRHWSEYRKFTGDALRNLALCPDGDLLVCGDNGGIYRLEAKQ